MIDDPSRPWGRFVALGVLALGLASCGDDEQAPTTTTVPAPTTWVGEGADGGTVVIVADEDVSFVGSVPAPVDLIQGLADCASVEGAIEFWSGRTGDPAAGDRASAFVVVAEQRLAELGCAVVSTA